MSARGTGSDRLILASNSPRRRELLQQIGLSFDVAPANIDESRLPGETPAAYVVRLALTKARAVAALHPGATVLGADTTVVLDAEILNKPRDQADAVRMLRVLSGRAHQVLTGVAVVRGEHALTHSEATTVHFGPIPEADLAAYVASGDPLDKAGAYGIQGFAARWIPRVEGDFFNVVGLPLAATLALLRAAGWSED